MTYLCNTRVDYTLDSSVLVLGGWSTCQNGDSHIRLFYFIRMWSAVMKLPHCQVAAVPPLEQAVCFICVQHVLSHFVPLCPEPQILLSTYLLP